jgi:hypothetical protein
VTQQRQASCAIDDNMPKITEQIEKIITQFHNLDNCNNLREKSQGLRTGERTEVKTPSNEDKMAFLA